MSVFVKASNWENEVVTKISSLKLDIGVYPYPNDIRKYYLKHNNGEVLVRYNGSKYADADISIATMSRTINMEITLVFRRLRDASGLYEVVEKICSELLGYRMECSTTGIVIQSDDFIGEDEGLWQFGIKISFKSDLTNKEFEDEYTTRIDR